MSLHYGLAPIKFVANTREIDLLFVWELLALTADRKWYHVALNCNFLIFIRERDEFRSMITLMYSWILNIARVSFSDKIGANKVQNTSDPENIYLFIFW